MPEKIKLNKLSIEIVTVPGTDEIYKEFRGVRILVDNIDLLDLILDFERPLLIHENRPRIEQTRTWPICNHRTKRILRGYRYYYDGAAPLVDCRCQCDGCWPIDVQIIRTSTIVKWKNFRNGHRPNWSYKEFGSLYFNRKAYDTEIAKIS